jgi:D-alanyl-D-alanine carboxypeptidase (penicillin-binding protein 5/6)
MAENGHRKGAGSYTVCGSIIMKRKKMITSLILVGALLISAVSMYAVHGSEAADLTLAGARAPSISAGAAILIDAGDGTVLYEYNADKKMYPASTTKIMTALVTLDICIELRIGLDSEIIVPKEAEGVEGSSLYLKEGERLTLEELLYGLMLHSGNDAAVALAETVGASEENFVEQMNSQAADLGCSGTHFVNPHGLYSEEHYTTARDLAVIARCAMSHPEFCRIVSAESWSGGESQRSFTNKNKTVFQYDGGNGVKIGYTKASGRTLVASASRNGTQLIAVVLNDGDWFRDAYGLLDFGFEVMETR